MAERRRGSGSKRPPGTGADGASPDEVAELEEHELEELAAESEAATPGARPPASVAVPLPPRRTPAVAKPRATPSARPAAQPATAQPATAQQSPSGQSPSARSPSARSPSARSPSTQAPPSASAWTPSPAPAAEGGDETATDVSVSARSEEGARTFVGDAALLALRDLCLAQLAVETDPERTARLHYDLGRLYEGELGDLTQAAQHYRATLEVAKDHVAAMRGARRALAALGKHSRLPPLFDAEVAVTREPAARARLLYEKARVMERALQQPGPALLVYREALTLDAGNVLILKAVERGHRREGAWGELAATYDRLAAAVTDPALRAVFLASRAHLTETKIGDPMQAASYYEAAAEADPIATPALFHVKRLGVSHQRWPSVIAALRREHRLDASPDARHAILCTIAEVQERHLGDADAAVRTLDEAFAAEPTDRTLLDELARLHTGAGRFAQAAEALARRVEMTLEPEAIATYCLRVAGLNEHSMRDLETALRWYARALEADPAHRGAASSLGRLLTEREDWAGLYRVWGTRARAIVDPIEQAILHHQMGSLLEERLQRPEEAIAQHARAHALDPAHHEAYRALLRLYTTSGRWHPLAELIERGIDSAPPAELVARLFQLGGVLEDRLEDPKSALAAYERILEHEPVNLGALHAIQRTAERARRYGRLVEALSQEAALTDEPARKNALLHRAAVVTADHVGDTWAADRSLEALLLTTPDHRPSLETLARLKAGAGKWEELVDIHARLLPLTGDVGERVRLHLRRAEVFEGQLGRDDLAVLAYREALALEPAHRGANEALAALLLRTGAFGPLAKHEESRLARIKEPRERARAAVQLALLYEERLGDGPRALASWQRALEAVPNHRAALDARARLLTDARDWQGLAAVLEEEGATLEDPYARMQAAMRAALVRAEHGETASAALESFRPVFTARSDHMGALHAVEEIYVRAANDAGLAATFERMAGSTRDPRAQLAALRSLAELRGDAGEDASEVWRRVLTLAPDDPTALEAIAEAARRAGDRDTLLSTHARLATIASDASVAAHHRTRLGEILLAARDARGALEAFRAALTLDPRSLTATRGLARAARAARDPVSMTEAARYETAVTRDRDAAVALWLAAARLFFDADHEEQAASAYEEALALHPDHPEAAMGVMMTMMRSEGVPRMIEVLTQAAHGADDPDRASILHLCVAQLQADVRHDLPAAIAAARRALASRPTDLIAHDRFAAYLERNAQWLEAVRALEEARPHAAGKGLAQLNLRLARIAEDHLKERERAMAWLREALTHERHHPEALTMLARLERLQGNDQEALRLVRSLLSVVQDDVPRAAALAEMAELEKGHGQLDAAAAAAQEAIAIQGPLGSAARMYRGLVASAPQHATWDAYCSALMTYLQRAKARRGDVAETYRELARVFGEAHDRPDRAIHILEEGTRAVPHDASISLALVRGLRTAAEDERALEELRRLLGVDVLEVGAWRAFSEIAHERREPDAASTLAPLVALGQAAPAEEQRARERRPRVAGAPAGMLGESGLKQLIDSSALDQSPAYFIPALLEILTKMEGIDHDRWGVAKRDRIRAGEPHPVRAMADRIGRVFGVPEFDVYMTGSRTQITRSYIIAGSPPALLVPTAVERAGDAVLAFHLARPLALLSRGLHPLDHVDDASMERILTAAVRQFVPSFSLDPYASEEELEAEVRRVGKAVGFFSKGRLQEAAIAFAQSPPAKYALWAKDLRRLATRAALLISDDLTSTLAVVGEELGPDNYASDLVRFWVSDAAMRFRRALHRG